MNFVFFVFFFRCCVRSGDTSKSFEVQYSKRIACVMSRSHVFVIIVSTRFYLLFDDDEVETPFSVNVF